MRLFACVGLPAWIPPGLCPQWVWEQWTQSCSIHPSEDAEAALPAVGVPDHWASLGEGHEQAGAEVELSGPGLFGEL